jgi:hypothetical protein
MIERPANDAGQRGRTADALDLWRSGERNVTRRTLSSDWRDDYQAAVDAALAYLQRYSTIVELVYVMRNQGTPVCLPDHRDDRVWRGTYARTCGPAAGGGHNS